jgi:hypothetical protein
MLAKVDLTPFELRTYKEALQDASSKEWQTAMQSERDSFRLTNTWCSVKRSEADRKGKRILRGKWVYKVKLGTNGEILKRKARWVVRGFEQTEGEDYTETFAAVVKPMSYKTVLAIAAAKNLEVEQMDVQTAFLEAPMPEGEEVFVEQPTGFEEGEDMICLLNKSLYGLKQSPRYWYQTLQDYLESMGFTRLYADHGIFVKGEIAIAVYVDDLLVVGPDRKEIQGVKDALNQRFKMTDLGPCSYYLGMTITRDRVNRILRLGQRAYIERFLKHYSVWENVKTCATPMDSTKLCKPEEGYTASKDLRERYQSAVGSLMYAMMGTRPDIALSVSVVSRYGSNPTQEHWNAVIRILRYLRTTISTELVYKGDLRPLAGYSDAD